MAGKNKNELIRRELQKLITRGILFLAVLALMICTSYAWYISNRKISGRQQSAGVEYDDLTAAFTAYKYEVNASRVVELSGITAEQLIFNQYDVIFKSRNQYTPIVIKINVAGAVVDQNNVLDLTIKRDPSKVDSPEGSQHYFTTAMRFTVTGGAGLYSEDPDTLYGNVNAAQYSSVTATGLGNTDSSKVFTQIWNSDNGSAYVKTDSITLSIPYSASDKIAGEDGKVTVYLYLSYDSTLIGQLGSSLMGIGVGQSALGTTIELQNDLVSISASVRSDG